MIIEQEITTYKEAVDYVMDIPKFAGKSTPEDTRLFYEFLGCPGEERNIIHVAGTNGKGSVCTYMDACLRAGGRTTGVFTSPHLVHITERFRIGERLMSEEEFLDCFLEVANQVNSFNQYHPSFFEYLFFMAMIWFEKMNVDYIILETGLGGRLDATNVIKKPVMTVITKIGIDHSEYLGNTIADISKEKAGIMKKGCPLVILDSCEESTEIFREYGEKLGIDVHSVANSNIVDIKIHQKFIDFYFSYSYHNVVCGESMHITLPTCAVYQTVNAALAVTAIKLLPDFTISNEQIVECLKQTVWEGRMEELAPDFYVDGAHNQDGVNGFIETLDASEVSNGILIFGVNKDKDYKEMLGKILESGHFRTVVFTRLNNPRTADPEELVKLTLDYTQIDVLTADNAKQALECARKVKGQDRIYAAGSLYLVGEFKELIMEESQ